VDDSLTYWGARRAPGFFERAVAQAEAQIRARADAEARRLFGRVVALDRDDRAFLPFPCVVEWQEP
jgi:hypothetical protein